jgi:hypothetical protein
MISDSLTSIDVVKEAIWKGLVRFSTFMTTSYHEGTTRRGIMVGEVQREENQMTRSS